MFAVKRNNVLQVVAEFLKPANPLELLLPTMRPLEAELLLCQLQLIQEPTDQIFPQLIEVLATATIREAVLRLATTPSYNLFQNPACRSVILLKLASYAKDDLVALFAMQTLEHPEFQDDNDPAVADAVMRAKQILRERIIDLSDAWNDFSLVTAGQDLLLRLRDLALGLDHATGERRAEDNLGSRVARELIFNLPGGDRRDKLFLDLALEGHRIGEASPWISLLEFTEPLFAVRSLLKIIGKSAIANPHASPAERTFERAAGLLSPAKQPAFMSFQLFLTAASWLTGFGAHASFLCGKIVGNVVEKTIGYNGCLDDRCNEHRIEALATLGRVRERLVELNRFSDHPSPKELWLIERIKSIFYKLAHDGRYSEEVNQLALQQWINSYDSRTEATKNDAGSTIPPLKPQIASAIVMSKVCASKAGKAFARHHYRLLF